MTETTTFVRDIWAENLEAERRVFAPHESKIFPMHGIIRSVGGPSPEWSSKMPPAYDPEREFILMYQNEWQANFTLSARQRYVIYDFDSVSRPAFPCLATIGGKREDMERLAFGILAVSILPHFIGADLADVEAVIGSPETNKPKSSVGFVEEGRPEDRECATRVRHRLLALARHGYGGDVFIQCVYAKRQAGIHTLYDLDAFFDEALADRHNFKTASMAVTDGERSFVAIYASS